MTLLQGGEHFLEIHHLRLGADGGPGVQEERHVRHPDAEIFHVIRRMDRFVRRQVARRAQMVVKRSDADFFDDFTFDFPSDVAGDDFLHMFLVAESVRHRHQRRLGRPVGHRFARDGKVRRSGPDEVQDIDFPAELAVRKDRDFDLAVRFLGDEFREFDRRLVPNVVFDDYVPHFPRYFFRGAGTLRPALLLTAGLRRSRPAGDLGDKQQADQNQEHFFHAGKTSPSIP